MIVEGKKLSAFDVIEAAMKLSDAYKEKKINKSITVSYYGNVDSFDLNIYSWDNRGKPHPIKKCCIYLDDVSYGDTFEKAFEIISKEMECLGDGRTD